jgi:hypothetical protein
VYHALYASALPSELRPHSRKFSILKYSFKRATNGTGSRGWGGGVRIQAQRGGARWPEATVPGGGGGRWGCSTAPGDNIYTELEFPIQESRNRQRPVRGLPARCIGSVAQYLHPCMRL